MKYKVYRNLDRPFSLLGINGPFIPFAGICLAVIIVLCIVIGSLAGTFVALAVALTLCVGGYLLITEVQQRFSPKSISRKLSSIGMPRFILVRSKVWKRSI